MIVFKQIDALQNHLNVVKQENQSIGFVPTMGALHQGHLSLIEQCRHHAHVTVASIFVNPTQFNDVKDFEKYPSTISKDLVLLESVGCDIVFLPSVSEIYPNGLQATTHYELGEIENLLEGKYRPGHFQGVAQVVHRLLDIVKPDYVFLGQKDYQQCMVIKKLASLIQSPAKVITSPTYREESGLAMSSRNLRLSKDQLQNATAIFEMLTYLKTNFKNQPIEALQQYATGFLLQHGFKKVDYVALADGNNLQPVTSNQQSNVVALVAAFIGDVRLIDNMVIS
jgi:pantoate--beta-alanine ligase